MIIFPESPVISIHSENILFRSRRMDFVNGISEILLRGLSENNKGGQGLKIFFIFFKSKVMDLLD